MYKGFAEVDTIPNTHKRLREEGYHVSVCMLRGLVRIARHCRRGAT